MNLRQFSWIIKMEQNTQSPFDKKILNFHPIKISSFNFSTDNPSKNSSQKKKLFSKKNKNLTTLGAIYNDIEKTKRIINQEINHQRENRKILTKMQANQNYSSRITQILKSKQQHIHVNTNSTLYSTPMKKKSKIFLTVNTEAKEENDEKESKTQRSKSKSKLPSLASSLDSIRTFVSDYSQTVTSGPRLKTFMVSYIPNWYEKQQLEHIKFSRESMRSQDLQIKTIKDEVLVLLDNIQIFKVRYLSSKTILTIFSSLEKRVSIKLNKILEETIGLMITSSYMLLMDFGDSVDHFILNPQWRVSREDDKLVSDESKEFVINAKIFNDTSNFLKSCHQTYEIIVEKENDFVFSSKEFMKLVQYLERCRYNVSYLIFTVQNLFKNYKKDQEIVDEYTKEMEKINKYDGTKKYFHKKTRTTFIGGIDYTRYKGPLAIITSEEQEKKNRILKCLDTNPRRDRKQTKTTNFDINSKLIDKLLKYATERFRTMICCERILRRFKAKEEFEKENTVINDTEF